MTEQVTRYHPLLVTLHWLLAVLIFAHQFVRKDSVFRRMLFGPRAPS